jgi:hypothetical protein
LGTDVLTRYFVVLDRSTMRIKFLPPDQDFARDYADWAQTAMVPRTLKKFPIQFWYLKARFNDRTITSLFDLGAGTTFMNWDAGRTAGIAPAQFSVHGPPPLALQDVLGAKSPAVQLLGLEVRLSGRSWTRQTAIAAKRRYLAISIWKRNPPPSSGRACSATIPWRSISPASACSSGRP